MVVKLNVGTKIDSKSRFVLDDSPANGAIKRTLCVMPTLEDFADEVNGSVVFSKFYKNEGFHQCELAEV